MKMFDKNKKFPLTLWGYSPSYVDEFLNGLLTAYWALEEQNKKLQEDMILLNKQINLQKDFNPEEKEWEEAEYTYLAGLRLQNDLVDKEGALVAEKGMLITIDLIDIMIEKGLYGELLHSASSC